MPWGSTIYVDIYPKDILISLVPFPLGLIHERLGPNRVGRSCWTQLESDATIGVRFSSNSFSWNENVFLENGEFATWQKDGRYQMHYLRALYLIKRMDCRFFGQFVAVSLSLAHKDEQYSYTCPTHDSLEKWQLSERQNGWNKWISEKHIKYGQNISEFTSDKHDYSWGCDSPGRQMKINGLKYDYSDTGVMFLRKWVFNIIVTMTSSHVAGTWWKGIYLKLQRLERRVTFPFEMT